MKTAFLFVLAALSAIVVAPFCQADDMTSPSFERDKKIMIERHLMGRDITDGAVIEAMRTTRREEFVPARYRNDAYMDGPLPIGENQTISQPYIVALMTQTINPKMSDVVLEIGTGSGYQAAVLSLLVNHVYTIEIIETLATSAAERLVRLGLLNVTVKAGDGYKGWPEHAPFDKIIVTAAASKVPKPLEEQLAEGGIIVMPVGGSSFQELVLGEKKEGKIRYRKITAVRFVPMTGEAQKQ